MDPATQNATICAEIGAELAKIEEFREVRILTAVESGSRAWGFASPDSDFDVRFLYVHTADHYLTVWDRCDVIEWPTEDSSLDITGWDIRKALSLMGRGNASVGEWLRSPLIYQWRFTRASDWLQDLEAQVDPRNYAWHYYGLATSNFHKYLRRMEVDHKRYLYVLRAIAAAHLVLEGFPLSTAMYPELPYHLPRQEPVLVEKVESLVRAKQRGDELMSGRASDWLHDYIERELTYLKAALTKLVEVPRRLEPLAVDEVFRAIVRDTWVDA